MPNPRTGYLTETERVIRKANYLKWAAENIDFSGYDKRAFNFLRAISRLNPATLNKLKFVPSNRSCDLRMTIASVGLAQSVCEITDERNPERPRVFRLEFDSNQMLNFIKNLEAPISVEMLYPGQDSCLELFSVIEYIPGTREDIQRQLLFSRDADKILDVALSSNKENVLKARIDNAIDSNDREAFRKATAALKRFTKKKKETSNE